MSKEIGLVYEVLDLQVVDVNGRRCGRVDDIEIEMEDGSLPTRATALLIGAGLYPGRLPGRGLRRLGRALVGPELMGKNVIRVPWDEIDAIHSRVQLKRPAEELGLGRGDDILAPVMAKLLLVSERKPK